MLGYYVITKSRYYDISHKQRNNDGEMLGLMLGVCYLFVRFMLGVKNRETSLCRGFLPWNCWSWENRKFYHPTPAALCSLPHPSCAHPSPTMGGELDTTCCPFGSPPQTAGTLASSAPHPSKGRGPGKGGGVKENCHETIYSQHGNKMFPTWE